MRPGLGLSVGASLFCNTKITVFLEVSSGKRPLCMFWVMCSSISRIDFATLIAYAMVIKTQLFVKQRYVCGSCFRSLLPPDFLLYISKVEIRVQRGPLRFSSMIPPTPLEFARPSNAISQISSLLIEHASRQQV
jgi:hypothetical protein